MFPRKPDKKKEFSKIYDENVTQIYRFAFLKVGSKDEAEDITSQTFLKVWKSFKNEETKKDFKSIRAYLYKTARNLIVDHYRRAGAENKADDKMASKKVPFENIVLKDENMRADEKAILSSEIAQIREALSKINEDYQNIIIWYYLDELTISEIADLLNKPESSVRVLIHRSMSALKKELNNGNFKS